MTNLPEVVFILNQKSFVLQIGDIHISGLRDDISFEPIIEEIKYFYREVLRPDLNLFYHKGTKDID